MSLQNSERAELVTLICGMFDAAPGATYYQSFAANLASGNQSLKDLAIDLANTQAFQSIYPSTLSDAEFASQFITKLVGSYTAQENTDWAIGWLETKLAGGTSRGEAVYEAVTALSNISHSDANWGTASLTLYNKHLEALDYSILKYQSGATLAELQAPLANISSDSNTLSEDASDFIVNPQWSSFDSTSGDDVITGTDDNDYIRALAGNDVINTLTGSDTVLPGEGNDTITFSGTDNGLSYQDLSAAVAVNLAQGTTTGTNKSDTFTTNVHNITGSEFDDTLIGGNSAGDEWEGFSGGRGNDTIDGGSGYDEILYDNDTGFAINANFALGQVTDGYGDTDTISNIEAVRGTRLDDTVIAGTQSFLSFRALAGNDTFQGAVYDAAADTGYERMDYSKDAQNKDSDGNYGTQGINVDLSNNTATDGFGDTDTLINIDRIRATDYDDILKGDDFDNRFDTKDGNDRVIFAGNWGNDRVSDFSRGSDKLDLSQTTLAFSDLTITLSDEDTLIVSGENSIKLSGVSAVDVEDFIFA